ncbi:MAG: type I restriction-modification system subunit M, partial [Fidelibacterota bacterium]
VIRDSYEYLIYNFASDAGKKGGEFYTPKEVSQLLALLLEPQSNEKICDPTCGSGSLLIRTANKVKSGNVSLYGQEMNGSTWSLCKMNVFLHDMDSARIERGDTINNPLLIKDNNLLKFDIVVANPPFSLKKWGYDEVIQKEDKYNRFHRGDPPRSRGDYAFLTHMIETINEHGRVGVVVPHGVLFRGGAEGKIRTKLVDENLLDTVIGLPSNLFFGTGIPAAILIFKKNREHKDVLFIDAGREFEKDKKQNRLRRTDLKKIYDTYKNRVFVDKYAHPATLEEIQENEYNLNIPRYVDTFEPEPEVDIAAVQKEIDEIETELVSVRKEMDKYLKELNL